MTARLPPREKGANACTIVYDMLARVFFALFFRVYKRKECENDTGIMHEEG